MLTFLLTIISALSNVSSPGRSLGIRRSMCIDDFQFDFFGRTKVIVLGVSENNPTTAENTCYSDDNDFQEMDDLP